MNTYKLGSLFDGSGGFPLAGTLCGITPVWAAEIEPYPIAVTRSRFPNMKHLGDISKVNGAEIEPVDIITFGSPCQDLSVAGKRAGLKHTENGDDETTRSGLFMEAVRIIKEMREATSGKYPRFALWENVPGAFSSNKGEDFRVVCEELIKVVEPNAVMPGVPKGGWAYSDSYRGDGWSLAYRVFDAQYWGVPQRRRRIYLVADFGGECTREVLFECEGLRGYFAEGRTPWQTAPGDAENSVGADDRERKCYGVVSKGNGEAWCIDERHMALACGGGQAGQGFPCVVQPIAVATQQGGAEISENGVCPTITAAAGMSGNNQPWICKVADSHILDDQGGQQISVRTDGKSPTLRAEMHGNIPCVMESAGFCPEESAKTRGVGYAEDQAPTLRAGAVPGVVAKVYDARGNGDGDICSTITGDHENRVTDYTTVCCYAIDQQGGKGGANYAENVMPTLCSDSHGTPHAVAYGISSYESNSMKSSNPHSGIYEADTSRTLDLNGGNPACNQGGIAVVEPICCETFHCTTEENKTQPLKARDYKDPLVVAAVDCRNASEDSVNGALQSSACHNLNSNNVVRTRYIVRRLTPTECARLQGFAYEWGHIDPKSDFSDEDYRFWLDVRNTHAAINGKATKDYTKAQMLTWYNKLHADSSEYKMWGNGIALPTALYCMQGIADVLNGGNYE